MGRPRRLLRLAALRGGPAVQARRHAGQGLFQAVVVGRFSRGMVVVVVETTDRTHVEAFRSRMWADIPPTSSRLHTYTNIHGPIHKTSMYNTTTGVRSDGGQHGHRAGDRALPRRDGRAGRDGYVRAYKWTFLKL